MHQDIGPAKMSHSLSTKDYGDTNFITGMRAFAALAVVLIHTGGAGLREFGTIGNNIADLGRTGVYVFFVISGFSVSASYHNSNGYFDYINRRMWRIAPLYYFWIFALSFITSLSIEVWGNTLAHYGTYNIALHALFLGFLDYRVTNSIIGVEWSIPIEVFWYFAVPIMLHGCRTKARTLGVLALSGAIYKLATTYPTILPVNEADAALAMHWSPIPYILSYALGIAAYRFRDSIRRSNTSGNIVFIATIVALLVFAYKPGFILRFVGDEFVFTSVLTALLILFGSGKSVLFKITLDNRVVQYLGVISYGLYMSHSPLHGYVAQYVSHPTLKTLAVIAAATAVSTLTYYLFELRLMQVGKRFGASPKTVPAKP